MPTEAGRRAGRRRRFDRPRSDPVARRRVRPHHRAAPHAGLRSAGSTAASAPSPHSRGVGGCSATALRPG